MSPGQMERGQFSQKTGSEDEWLERQINKMYPNTSTCTCGPSHHLETAPAVKTLVVVCHSYF